MDTISLIIKAVMKAIIEKKIYNKDNIDIMNKIKEYNVNKRQ